MYRSITVTTDFSEESKVAFDARLIIMSSRGLSVLDRNTLGSVAEQVIQGAKCPVLVDGRNR